MTQISTDFIINEAKNIKFDSKNKFLKSNGCGAFYEIIQIEGSVQTDVASSNSAFNSFKC